MTAQKGEKEAQARIKINKLLEEAGWILSDSEGKKANVRLEEGVKLSHLGDDFEHSPKGAVDYLLLDSKGFPICVLEAKRESIHPLTAKEQGRDYAISQNVRFVILSNGNAHYLWDRENGNPQFITEFPSQESFEHRSGYEPDPKSLVTEKVGTDYLAPIKTLRPYQVEAINALQASAGEEKMRFLFEMATGTGKTTTSAAICKLFLKTGNAKRILFLVDRIELEDQAVKAFKEIFANDYFTGTVKSGEWRKCQIVVSTIQTLMVGDRYKKLFSPTDFELVISDEAHRSIGGNARAVFEYFIGYKLGLTATPKDYLKGLDETSAGKEGVKGLELRNLRDTYRTFGCDSGEPTYRYDLKKGVREGYLINPYVVDARTEVTTQLLSKEGYVFETENENGETIEGSAKARDFEKTFFNDDTNRIFAEAIVNNGLKDPLTGEFGKMLVFCVSVSHAAKMVNFLNEAAMKKWPGKYQSDFAMQVTSLVPRAQDFTKDFTNNRLSGKSRFAESTHPDYDTSKTRVCVTVGMMTTGYDCPDLLGVTLLRPVFSPADFVQMKGRGTRKCDFTYRETGEKAEKTKFLLLDCFGNCEFFENEFDYDKRLELPKPRKETGPVVIIDPPPKETVDADVTDKILTETVITIGSEGMKIDRALYERPKHEQFEYVMRNSETVRKTLEEGDLERVEELVLAELFDKPTEFWNADSLRKSYESINRTRRHVPLKELIAKALGLIDRFATREERIESEWQKFLAIEKPATETAEGLNALKTVFETYLSDAEFRSIVDKGEFARLETHPMCGMPELMAAGAESVRSAREYVTNYLRKEMKEFELVTA